MFANRNHSRFQKSRVYLLRSTTNTTQNRTHERIPQRTHRRISKDTSKRTHGHTLKRICKCTGNGLACNQVHSEREKLTTMPPVHLQVHLSPSLQVYLQVHILPCLWVHLLVRLQLRIKYTYRFTYHLIFQPTLPYHKVKAHQEQSVDGSWSLTIAWQR